MRQMMDMCMSGQLNKALRLHYQYDPTGSPSSLLSWCIREHQLEELKVLCSIPELQLSKDFYWPLRQAIHNNKPEAIEILLAEVESIETFAERLLKTKIGSMVNGWVILNYEGYDFFGTLIPDSLTEQWMKAFGEENCPLIAALNLSRQLPGAQSPVLPHGRL